MVRLLQMKFGKILSSIQREAYIINCGYGVSYALNCLICHTYIYIDTYFANFFGTNTMGDTLGVPSLSGIRSIIPFCSRSRNADCELL